MAKKTRKTQRKLIVSIISIIILTILVLIGNNSEIVEKIAKVVGINITINDDEKYSETNADNVNEANTTIENENSSENLKVYFIDVGQADSILVTNKEQSMLIDAGNNDDGENVVKFIKDKEIAKLNYVIGTHPHEDHIGGLDNVINNIDTENIYMPKQQTNTKTFEEVLDAISNKGLKVTAPKKGDIFNIGDAKCEVMTDSILDSENLNLSSNIIKLTYGNNSFLFTGDAEQENEKTRNWEHVDVLKVGHHGSKTSSSKKFLTELSPKYAIIMAGENNSYGLPKNEILKRLESVKSKIYRTDKNGTIEAESDGNNITFKTEK